MPKKTLWNIDEYLGAVFIFPFTRTLRVTLHDPQSTGPWNGQRDAQWLMMAS